ncbi:Mechanosensitive ion channel [Formivibrio citricus]|uniref:Mechanosensitive ion channel n=1 Tax=Formivibrio citricus TaxID=83765 RepID=A0A1I5CN09_9NEIS|nr:mechanosensitive ion channel domain-containing protein [Formivibrio citricus]SFN88400.1 Mechanosensitive ion channel [Formivibrio citricus]
MSARHSLVVDFYRDLSRFGFGRPEELAQLTLIVLALGLAWLLNRAFKQGAAGKESSMPARIGREGLARVLFPLTALVLTLLGGSVLRRWFAPQLHLLDLASMLLMAMLSIRLLVYLLRYIFHEAEWVRRSEKLISATIWLGYALHVSGILPELWEMLDAVQLHVGKSEISLLGVLQAAVSVVLTVLAALWLCREVERRLMGYEAMEPNVRVMIIKVTRALLVVASVLIALPLVGIDLTVLSVFGGALGVGLGFGLQKIASNYVSGFIILMDRSVKIGDLVQIDTRHGVVAQLTSRYIVLRGLDGNEALIPNETLITSTVVNQSYTDRLIRVGATVQVAYGTDVELAMRLMEKAGVESARVVADPPPQAFLKNFGDNGIELELGAWIKDPENGVLSVRSAINLAIWHAFQANGIQIPFPQRELRIVQAGSASSIIPHN